LIARIYVKLKRDVSDPQGHAVKGGLESLEFKGVKNVHVGKYFVLEMDDMEKSAAEAQVKEMCEKLLSNPVIEDYEYTLEADPAR
jgi:phosphoribosylformylglycinamidine synthase subunit PurS